ncbi:DUF4350 domain-containing protein [Streptomyces sp. TP-A0874]|uniref:DUF4350 domain-containing protein n=1 Tax=Streptomyces sp. TP-A0874 TaxID=549819 RepID=UPI0008535E8B|nr:DUF4350 domain-containing protein [Streptomyces sp. TP-A0874]
MRQTAPRGAAEQSSSPAATAGTSSIGRKPWSRFRGPLLALAVLIVAGLVFAAIGSGERHGRLDPHSTDRFGSRAVAELLEDHGVITRLVTTTEEAVAAAGPDSTLLLANPDLLSSGQRAELSDTASRFGRTILIAPGPSSVGFLVPGVDAAGTSPIRPRSPECAFATAERAGTAETGGLRYTHTGSGVQACYPSSGLPTLLRLPGPADSDTVVIGAPDVLYNHRLAEHGNASLALQLLGSRPHLVWYLPSLADTAAVDSDGPDFFELIPAGWYWAVGQLLLAAALTALWRARRLGPLVTEGLPVPIPASEVTEGRARLYRRVGARDRASEALRSASRARIAPLLGVTAAQADRPDRLCPAVADRVGVPVPVAEPLLFGPAPKDDAALVRLATDLDDLEHRITSGTTSPVSRTLFEKDTHRERPDH